VPLIRPDINIPMSALLKRFVAIYLPVVILLPLVIALSMRVTEERRMEVSAAQESSHIDSARNTIVHDFAMVSAELKMLSDLPSLRHYLDSGSPASRNEVAEYFVDLARGARHYDQVRYLDASGHEVIRVNYGDGKPYIVPREQLQDKFGRYFFRDTFRLNRGDIYVSPLDLNIENDRLEVPYKPMIRFGTPVFDSAGRKRGVVLLNYFGSDLIRDFRDAMVGGDPRRSMLLNRDGYWLASPNPADEWGFMLGNTDRTFGHEFPDVWRAISASEHGNVLTPKGLFTWGTVYPLLPEQYSSTGSPLPRAESRHEVESKDYYWKIVSFVPGATWSEAVPYEQSNGRLLVGLVYVLLALAAWIISIVTLSRRHARAELARSKARYDEMVQRIPVGVYLLHIQPDGAMGFEYVSPVFCRILGLDADAVLHDVRKAFTAAHPEDMESLIRATQEVAVTLNPFHWEGRFVVFGETRWVRIEANPRERPHDGSVWCGVVSDITDMKHAEQMLALHSELVEQMAEGMLLVQTGDRKIVLANPAFEQMFGYAPGELVGKDVAILNAPTEKSPEDVAKSIVESLRQKKVWRGEIENINKDGRRVWCFANITTFVHPLFGEVWLDIHQDITERKRAEEALRKSSEEIEDLYNNAPCGYHSMDETGLVLRMNNTELEWLGYSREEVVGKMHYADLLTPEGLAVFNDHFPRFLETGYVHDLEFEVRRKDGSQLPILLSGTAVRDASGRFVMSRSTLFDLTERKKMEQELQRQARIDMLTGLNNRRHFFELAEQQLARARRFGEPLSLLMLDLDNFKGVNDTYGHQAGDAALQKLAEVSVKTLREIDILGRIGGEEFAALLTETGGAEALEVAERLRVAVLNSVVALDQGPSFGFTISVGVAAIEPTDTKIDAMLKRADSALYKAKESGRNRVYAEGINGGTSA
jgi:diguanylate cyclase (GGDEF)-like protein/PAS domain S-box-containing protein